jgi:membrane-bound lytic murein transglycosylase D
MLNTRFVKAFYLCNSFLLVTTSFTPVPKASNSFAENGKINLVKNSFSGKLHTTAEPEIQLNRKGMIFVKKYIRNSSECLVGVKKRSMVPFSIIDSVFNCYGLPVELKYLAVIESELKPAAQSQVGARGPWQLMPGTAKVLGLKVTRQYDERTNYYLSTRAAARYLKDLYAQFDDWLLVLAAYNGGPKPVYDAIRESGSRNFWVLQNYLPAESREHVKKFIATHYYFEGSGSETTRTRAENKKYEKTVNAFLKSHPAVEMVKTGPVKPEINSTYRNWMNMTAKTSAIQESSEQKFRRIMKESEESLMKSRKII